MSLQMDSTWMKLPGSRVIKDPVRMVRWVRFTVARTSPRVHRMKRHAFILHGKRA